MTKFPRTVPSYKANTPDAGTVVVVSTLPKTAQALPLIAAPAALRAPALGAPHTDAALTALVTSTALLLKNTA